MFCLRPTREDAAAEEMKKRETEVGGEAGRRWRVDDRCSVCLSRQRRGCQGNACNIPYPQIVAHPSPPHPPVTDRSTGRSFHRSNLLEVGFTLLANVLSGSCV